MFSKHVGIRYSNEAEVLVILEALRIFCPTYQQHLIVESNSLNVVSWVNSFKRPWKMQFYLDSSFSVSVSGVILAH